MYRSASIALPLTILVSPACLVTKYKDSHCSNNDGDEFCRREHPDLSRPYCSFQCEPKVIDGCVESEPEPSCYSPCGDRRPLTADPTCEPIPLPEDTTGTGTDTTTSETETIGESSESTTGPQPCQGNEDCPDIGAPFCEPATGECVRCDATPDPDAACATLDPDVPLCVDGTCVACTPENPVVCDDQLLLCDPGTNICASCTEHTQCEAGACDVSDGRCFDPAHVLHVGMGQPYVSITAALDDVGAMMLDTAVLVLHQGVDFNEAVTVDAGVLAIVAAEGEQPQWVNTAVMAPTVTVTGVGTRVYLHRVRLTQNGNDLGLLVDGARVDLRRSRVVQNAGGGILAQNGAELTLRNCFIGGDVSDANALEVNGATASVVYSTLGAGTFNAAAVICNSPMLVEVRNSVLVSRGGTPPDEVSCVEADIRFSATEGMVDGLGNTPVGMFPGATPEDWFADYGTGNFHLQNDGLPLFADIAQWQTGDPPTDIDGDPRPTMDGTPDYAGADAVP